MLTDDGKLTRKATGYLVLIAAFGMLCVSSSSDIKQLTSWAAATTPAFVGTLIGHVGAVITAYLGGRMTPTHHDD